MWLKANGFLDKVKSRSENYHFQGNPSDILAKKLTALKLDLKERNETDFNNVTAKKQQLWSKLNALDVQEESQPLTDEEKLEKATLHSKLKKTTLLEEISWRQKSGVPYLKEGDSNRRNNCIENLIVDGVLTSN